MGRQSRWEYLRSIHGRYRRAGREERGRILDEFCEVAGYNRKYAIRLLNGPPPERAPRKRRPRRPTYGPKVISVLLGIWTAAGYPWSVRLKALLPLWLPSSVDTSKPAIDGRVKTGHSWVASETGSSYTA